MKLANEGLIGAIEGERLRRNMDQKTFCGLLGFTESHYSMLKTGKRRPTLDTLTILMQKLPSVTPAVTAFIVAQGDNHQTEEKESHG